MAGRDARLKRLEQAADRDRQLRQVTPMRTLTVGDDGVLRDADGREHGRASDLKPSDGYLNGPIAGVIVPARPESRHYDD
jgi:hypothetical protein